MTEKEKMLSGEYYFGLDKELLNERENAKELCFQFNSMNPSKRKKEKKEN